MLIVGRLRGPGPTLRGGPPPARLLTSRLVRNAYAGLRVCVLAARQGASAAARAALDGPRWFREHGAQTISLIASILCAFAFLDGLGRVFPANDFDPVTVAESSPPGKIELTYHGVDADFAVFTRFSFFDSSYRRSVESTEPLFPGRIDYNGAVDTNLGILRISAFATSTPPEGQSSHFRGTRFPWVLTSTGAGQLGTFARVEDYGKYTSLPCTGSSWQVTRVPDNAVPIDMAGPDPRKLSIGYMNNHPYRPPQRSGRIQLNFGKLGGAADAGAGLHKNSEVRGRTTVFAGTVCTAPNQDHPVENTNEPCMAKNATAVISAPLPELDKAVAQALGSTQKRLKIYQCLQLVSVGPIVGRMGLGAYLADTPVNLSASGGFAYAIPDIEVKAVDRQGKSHRMPFEVDLFDRRLIVPSHLGKGIAPAYPLLKRTRLGYVSETVPAPIGACSTTPCRGPQSLVWLSRGERLAVFVTGIDGRLRERFEREQKIGQIEWAVALSLLLPLSANVYRWHRRRQVQQVRQGPRESSE